MRIFLLISCDIFKYFLQKHSTIGVVAFGLVGDIYIRLMKLRTNGWREADVSMFWRVGDIFGKWVFIWFIMLLRSSLSD